MAKTRRALVRFVSKTTEPSTNKPVLQVWTDFPDRDYECFYIERTDNENAIPKEGDTVEWTTSTVFWNGIKLRKIGYAFNPDVNPL